MRNVGAPPPLAGQHAPRCPEKGVDQVLSGFELRTYSASELAVSRALASTFWPSWHVEHDEHLPRLSVGLWVNGRTVCLLPHSSGSRVVIHNPPAPGPRGTDDVHPVEKGNTHLLGRRCRHGMDKTERNERATVP